MAALTLCAPRPLFLHLALRCSDFRPTTWTRGARRAKATGADLDLVAARRRLLTVLPSPVRFHNDLDGWLRLPTDRAYVYIRAGLSIWEARGHQLRGTYDADALETLAAVR